MLFFIRTESTGSGQSRSTRRYSGYENYLNYQVVFVSKHSSNQDLYIEVGDYSYPFQIMLPSHLPTSFEHSIGRVRYSIYATVDIPWAVDKHSQRSFSVINHLDLNSNPSLKTPYGVTDTKILCCGFCKSDPITATLGIMKSNLYFI
jgi:hypothetical protein